MFFSAPGRTALASWATRHLAATPTTQMTDLSEPDTRHLIETIICMLDRLAADTATVASGVNTLRTAHGALKPSQISRFLPVVDQKLSELLLTFEDGDLTSSHSVSSAMFLATLDDGCQIVRQFADEEKTLGRERVRILYGERLRHVWRDACRSAITLIDATNDDLRLVLPLAYRQNAAVLKSLLAGAANGLSPCLNEDRQLYLPKLPQQRRWPRRSVLQSCTVECDGKTFDAFIHDASAGGLGLDKLPKLARNTPVRVITESGRKFDCVVAWANDGRVGVKFPALLSQNDPLIAG